MKGFILKYIIISIENKRCHIPAVFHSEIASQGEHLTARKDVDRGGIKRQ